MGRAAEVTCEAGGLLALGRRMEQEPGVSLRAAAEWLKVRDRTGQLLPLQANAAQRMFEQRRGRQNIVLKARQMGMTTWVAGRFFLQDDHQAGDADGAGGAHAGGGGGDLRRWCSGCGRTCRRSCAKGRCGGSRANAGQMVFAELDSEFRVVSAGDDECGARA